MGLGIKGVGSGIRRVGTGITALGSGITDHGIGISSFFREQGSGSTIFVESGTKIGHAFGIKNQKSKDQHWKNIPRYNPGFFWEIKKKQRKTFLYSFCPNEALEERWILHGTRFTNLRLEFLGEYADPCPYLRKTTFTHHPMPGYTFETNPKQRLLQNYSPF